LWGITTVNKVDWTPIVGKKTRGGKPRLCNNAKFRKPALTDNTKPMGGNQLPTTKIKKPGDLARSTATGRKGKPN